MFESFNIPGLYIAVQVRICYSIILKKSGFNVIPTPASQTLGLLIISSVPSPVSVHNLNLLQKFIQEDN